MNSRLLVQPPRAVETVAPAAETTPASPSSSDEARTGPSQAYPFTAIEAKWQEYWEKNQTFRTPDQVDTSKPKYYVLDMFPYPRCVWGQYHEVAVAQGSMATRQITCSCAGTITRGTLAARGAPCIPYDPWLAAAAVRRPLKEHGVAAAAPDLQLVTEQRRLHNAKPVAGGLCDHSAVCWFSCACRLSRPGVPRSPPCLAARASESTHTAACKAQEHTLPRRANQRQACT